MKKFLLVICMLCMIPCFADTLPYFSTAVPKDAIGLYQTGEQLTIYSHPDSNSHVLRSFDFSYKQDSMPEGVFALLLNERRLGMLYVSDLGDDNWVEVIYDKSTGARGWVMTEDKFQFMPWLNFYNMYGRKYGLRLFKDAPDSVDILHSKSEDLSQSVAKLNYVKQIKLTRISGNWALVSVFDLDKVPKMGFMRWRGDDGKIYAFPNIK